MEIFVLSLLGLCFGSFVNALVWRVRHKRDMLRERSECTHCHHTLAWYDLLPVASWLMLRGRCRYCRRPIDDTPLVELATAALFVVSYLAWPYAMGSWVGIALFASWLLATIILVALSDYDIRWKLLPDVMVFPLIGLGLIIGVLRFYGVEGSGIIATLVTMSSGVAVIAGLYYVLYRISGGSWVGFGDIKLNIFIGLILGWQGAILAVFVANMLGTLWVVPGIVSGRLGRRSQVPFGPFLIAATIIVFLWGNDLIQWYLTTLIAL